MLRVVWLKYTCSGFKLGRGDSFLRLFNITGSSSCCLGLGVPVACLSGLSLQSSVFCISLLQSNTDFEAARQQFTAQHLRKRCELANLLFCIVVC